MCSSFFKDHSLLRLITVFATSWILSMLQLNKINKINAISICAQHWCISVYFLFKVHCKATSTLLLAYWTCQCYQTVSVFWLSDQFDFHGSVHCRCTSISKYNQQYSTLHNLFISVKCSTCFTWYLRPSSGAQNCTYNIGYLSKLCCCLPLSWKSWNSSMIAAGSSKGLTSTRCSIYSFELLMMGGGIEENQYFSDGRRQQQGFDN
jgi:hypothetical protein